MIEQWVRLLDNQSVNTFELAPFATVEFMLTLTSNIEADERANLILKATYQIDTTTRSEDSEMFSVSISGPAAPPQGVTLPLGIQLDQDTTLNAMLGGWAVAILLLAIIYTRRNRKGSTEGPVMEDQAEEVLEEETEEETPLGFNECRMENGKVTCPSCDARLGVPRGSEAPFRFTCPKCQTMIRVVE